MTARRFLNPARPGLCKSAPAILPALFLAATLFLVPATLRAAGGAMTLNGATSGTVVLQAPAVAGSTTFQLPGNNGTSGYMLTTNGAGVTSWAVDSATVTGGTIGSGSGVLAELQAGSAAAPSLTFYADIATGLYQPAVHTMAVSTNGVERLAFDGSGNVNLTTAQASFEIGGSNGLSEPLDSTPGSSIAIGPGALANQTAAGSAAYQNIAIGLSAMGTGTLTTAAVENVAVGFYAMAPTTTGTQNTAIGSDVMSANTSGSYNSAVGTSSLITLTTGCCNAVQGQSAGYSLNGSANVLIGNGAGGNYPSGGLTSGNNNTFIGFQVGSTTTTTGSSNILIGNDNTTEGATSATTDAVGIGTGVLVGTGDTAVGYQALHTTPADDNLDNTAIGYQAMGTGTLTAAAAGNTAIGYQALTANTSGLDNFAAGLHALKANTSGQYNTAIGAGALAANTIGTNNTAIGNASANGVLYVLSSGSNNTAIGGGGGASNNGPLGSVTTGSGNTAIGGAALQGLTSGSDNTAVGELALYSATGSPNDAIGYEALKSVSTGTDNVALGYEAGFVGTAITTGTDNTFIGYEAQSNGAAYTNGTALGYQAILTASNTITLGNSAITAIHAQVQTITALSDRRHKKDITDSDLGLDFIEKLRPVYYRFNNGDETLRYGFIAQDVEQALPKSLQDLVENSEPGHALALIERGRDKDHTYSMGYGDLFSPIVKSIQQQQQQIEADNKEIAALAAQLAALQSQISKLTAANVKP
jgi:hypothetical protein